MGLVKGLEGPKGHRAPMRKRDVIENESCVRGDTGSILLEEVDHMVKVINFYSFTKREDVMYGYQFSETLTRYAYEILYEFQI